ncbi:XRE family transcriptional regulator [Streptomyces sp. ID38640]|uniref:XRE family transcriptional regulator n=1 Tax=Streptomyces sp. ID38640 TaxID=1265399 RepID=UPI00140EBC6F|nr:XRE family transcriptional regulator [Streptomyces sp. ID38640]QIK08380.1 XRE family transcriptional regulator [Streptomyces sp. ID38640]
MDTTRNQALTAWMAEHGFSSNTLADAVNRAVGDLTGRPGGLDGSSVRDWKAGRVRWPKSATRAALEKVTGLPAIALGFVPRGRAASAPAPPQEDPVNRRSFLTATAASAALPLPTTAARHRIGASDIARLQHKFAAVVAGDHQHGGMRGIETRALELAAEAVDLQDRGSAGQRVRSQLYAVAAAFTSSAMWAAIDGRRFDAARRRHERAAGLAVMSGDQMIQFRIWSHAGSLYRHMGRPSDALAANDVARSLPITRRDPLFASLGHARHAAIHGLSGNRYAVERAIGYAQDAADRADPDAHRPLWLAAVRDRAELAELALSAYLSLGDFERAEAQAHRSLTLLRPYMQRDRALVTARLAQAQLGQGEVASALNTAMSVPLGAARHPRVAHLLAAFGTGLRKFAPDSPDSRTWTHYQREALTDHRSEGKR